MEIILKNGDKLALGEGATAEEAARCISEGLARAAVAAKVNGVLVDLSTPLKEGDALEIVTLKDEEGLTVYRHTCAHVLAQALKTIYPTCKLAIGPTIENGFYYDVDFKTPISMDDFDKIEAEMAKIVKSNLPIERFTLPRDEAIALMSRYHEKYKVEIIQELPEDAEISFYRQGAFTDLCRGPHLPSTGKIKAFKLVSIAGAYWRGDEKKKMLTRIYGTAFAKKEEVQAYLEKLEEAKKRDHNKLGRDLGIFMTSDVVGQGLPILMPKGAKMLQVLTRFVEDEEARRGFMITKTPNMAKSDLYKISGHWAHYRDKMFILGEIDAKGEAKNKDEEIMALRPMTCPFQYQIYKNGLKSYRDLPCRYSETATEFRNEASGEMHGLIRVRQFTLSDGHIICTKEQVEGEFKRCLDLSYYILDCLGMRGDVTFRFSKRKKGSDKYIDDDEAWDNTEAMMKTILDDLGLNYVEAPDEAAFYGPKLDVQIKNVFGKEDTLITIQIDFAAGHSFGMEYVDADGVKKTPYVIHRSSIGCYERTLAFLIEKYAGAFPLWFAPVQVKVLPVTDRAAEYASALVESMAQLGLRAEADLRKEKIGRKILDAEHEKVPYKLIVGDKEVEDGTVSVRKRSVGDIGSMRKEDFLQLVKREDTQKVIF